MKNHTIIELCEPTKFKRLVLGPDATLLSNGNSVDVDELDISNSDWCAIVNEVSDLKTFIKKLKTRVDRQTELLERAETLLCVVCNESPEGVTANGAYSWIISHQNLKDHN